MRCLGSGARCPAPSSKEMPSNSTSRTKKLRLELVLSKLGAHFTVIIAKRAKLWNTFTARPAAISEAWKAEALAITSEFTK